MKIELIESSGKGHYSYRVQINGIDIPSLAVPSIRKNEIPAARAKLEAMSKQAAMDCLQGMLNGQKRTLEYWEQQHLRELAILRKLEIACLDPHGMLALSAEEQIAAFERMDIDTRERVMVAMHELQRDGVNRTAVG